MSDILPFLKELLSVPGLSGYEKAVAQVIEARWKPLLDTLQHSRLGSLHGLRRGCGAEPRCSLMIATHMDSIGLMVSGFVGEFLRVSAVGGVDDRILPGQAVTVHASGGGEPHLLSAVVAQPPVRLLPPEIGENPVPREYLLVDTGLGERQVKKLVQVGDLISFASPPYELSGETLAGHTLDNRASVAALTVCLEELQSRDHEWDVWAVATVQEEVGLIGAFTSAYDIHPTLALVVDVTWGRGPGANDWNTFPLGKGPTLVMGPNIHLGLYQALKGLADRLEIPYAVEYAPRHTGTDAFAIQITAEGIPSALIGIPLRYMHTPVEVVSIKDIQRAGRLLAEFITTLKTDWWEKVSKGGW